MRKPANQRRGSHPGTRSYNRRGGVRGDKFRTTIGWGKVTGGKMMVRGRKPGGEKLARGGVMENQGKEER
jgi:hypothetical protein